MGYIEPKLVCPQALLGLRIFYAALKVYHHSPRKYDITRHICFDEEKTTNLQEHRSMGGHNLEICCALVEYFPRDPSFRNKRLLLKRRRPKSATYKI